MARFVTSQRECDAAANAIIIQTDVNLSDLQKQLDAQGIEIVDNQKESVVGRKALADKTKGAWCTGDGGSD